MNPDSDDETIQSELLNRKRKPESSLRCSRNPMIVMEEDYRKEIGGGAWKKGRDEDKEYEPGLRAAEPQLLEQEDLLAEGHPSVTMAGFNVTGNKDLFDEETHAKMRTNWGRYQEVVRKAQEELDRDA